MSGVSENLARVRAGVPAGVTLVAVSKGQPASAIREAYAAGQRDFGENYAQEWRDKAAALADLPDVAWHFIGSLQTNKVKYLAGRVAWVHTVDRLALAEELSRRSAAIDAVTRVLIEVNIGAESSKSGCAPDEAPSLVRAVAALRGLEVRGLMCIPPAEGDPRPRFAALRKLRDGIPMALPDLSMGMSSDYPIAITEGATLIRVGTAIFGARPPR